MPFIKNGRRSNFASVFVFYESKILAKMLIFLSFFSCFPAREPTAEEKLHEDLLEHYYKGTLFKIFAYLYFQM